MTGMTQEQLSAATSRRIEPFAASVWPWVDQMAERNPEAVFFGGGVPPTEAIPVARLREGADQAWADGAEILLYGEVRGYRPLRELIVERMAARGAIVDPADVLITNGAQQGIDLAARIFIDPGDIVLTEEPTFMDALRVFRSHEAEPVGVPIDEEGLQVDVLTALLDRLPKRPKFLYTMPTYQNPTGVSMSTARRRALVELAWERGLVIVEDDPYGDLSYDGNPPPTLKSLDPEVIFLGTFSKVLAPGLRVGWVASSPRLREAFFNVKEGTDIHNERIMTRTVYHSARGFLDEHVAATREIYRARRDAMLAGLEREMPAGVRWTTPGGGFFLWVTLPEQCETDVMLPDATDRGVIYLPSSWFYPDRSWTRSLRLNFSAQPEERIAEAMRRLAETINAF
ncbi:MAG: putative transcriptional regulator, GntR family [Thermomicrobiales bacterium]|nr:putative transcriptional regulator, GntR family [Thermomicrobiales bacterium]MDF3015809.1 putative transcriptional regulator, GntR family [Thermomicrobiales bacterium]